MFKRRLIAVLYLKDGWMVRSEDFSFHQYIGDPVAHVNRLVEWDVDELIVLDIGAEESRFDHHRMDYRHKPVTTILEFVERAGVQCAIPLTIGGRIRTLEDIALRILNGADKVALNTLLHRNPALVGEAARAFGAQALVASIDYRMVEGQPRVFVERGRTDTGATVLDWAKRAEDLGAGEILLNAMDRDGMAQGFDLTTIARTAEAVSIPVIACGGAGTPDHFLDVLRETRALAVAAGNIFHFKENAYPNAKAFLRGALGDIR
jgi:cyclase